MSDEHNDVIRNDMIRGPKWRTRTTPGRRRFAATITVALITLVGLVILLLVGAGLGRLGAPGWVRALPWVLPIVGAVLWTLRSPGPAVLSDDDDDSWTGYSVRWALVGPDEPRPVGARLVAAIVLGAPIVWSFVVLGIFELAGIF